MNFHFVIPFFSHVFDDTKKKKKKFKLMPEFCEDC